MEDTQILQVKWQGKTFDLHFPKSAKVYEVKEQLAVLTQVTPLSQKLAGLLPKGKVPDDMDTLGSLNLNNPHKVMMIGTSKEEKAELAKEEAKYLERKERERIAYEEELIRQREREERLNKERMERMAMEEASRREQDRIYRERMEAERQERLQREIQMETDESAMITVTIPHAYSSAIANKPELEAADKILLPPSMLEKIINSKLSMPLTFVVVSERELQQNEGIPAQFLSHEVKVHAGVLDFTAPSDTAHLPYWMMKKLALNEGDSIVLSNVKLPKGEFVKLQPHNAEWIEIPEGTRKSILEYTLRNYQSLTLKDTIKVDYYGKMYDFDVLELKPEDAVDILNTDISVDVIEPLERPVAPEDVKFGEQIVDNVGNNLYKYYRVQVDDVAKCLQIEAKATKGDINLYLSNIVRRPTRTQCTWYSQQVQHNTILLDANQDSRYQPGMYYIGVQGYNSDAEFTLNVSLVDPTDKGHMLKDVDMEDTVETVQCENCQKRIPKQTYQMHLLGCIKRNFRCSQCNKVMNTNEKEKHMDLSHSLLSCSCGAKLQQDDLLVHQEHDCPLRLVKCLYCPLQVPIKDRGSHQQICGNRTASCVHCNASMKRKEMKQHLAEVHSITMREITQSGEFEHFL